MTGKEYACRWWRSRRWRAARTRQMRTEIRIHKSVACEHVVRFERCFEDDMHVHTDGEVFESDVGGCGPSRGDGVSAAACYIEGGGGDGVFALDASDS